MPWVQYWIQSRICIGYSTFFRERLLTSSAEEVADYVEGLEKEAKQIRVDSLKLAWFMRGGITYDQVLLLSHSERTAIGELVKENYEITKKSGLPHFWW